MSAQIAQDLRATGVAQVIVVMRPAAAATSKQVKQLEEKFTTSELSRTSAVAAALSESHAGGRAKRPGSRRATAAQTKPKYYPNLGILYGTVDREGLASLRNDKQNVASVHGAPQLSIIWPVRTADAKLAAKHTWGIEALGVPALWKQGLTGKDVIVGHLDTGIDGKHPGLKAAIRDFAEFDELGNQVMPAPKPHDTDDHGTHTAGTIAGRPVSGKRFGVAPGAELVSAIVIEGGDVTARVLGGMDWALGQGARVLNMSLGFRGFFEDFQPLTSILRARGVLPVYAVGNEGPGTSRSPGNYPEALSVGAIARDLSMAPFSSSQTFKRKQDAVVPDLIAPGVDVISAKPGGGFQSMDGSSMATPHIAGLAALLLEAAPTATIDDVETAIFRSCTLSNNQPSERANRGLPNGSKALGILQSLQP